MLLSLKVFSEEERDEGIFKLQTLVRLDRQPLFRVDSSCGVNHYGEEVNSNRFRLERPCCGFELNVSSPPLGGCHRCNPTFSSFRPEQLMLKVTARRLFYSEDFLRRFLAYHLFIIYPEWLIIERAIVGEEILLCFEEAFPLASDGEWTIEDPPPNQPLVCKNQFSQESLR